MECNGKAATRLRRSLSRVACSGHVSCYPAALLLFSAQFRLLLAVCVCVCVSCVRVACRRGILSLCRRRRPRDKVLSYDLLKCPNATITRDYYKCIPRVQRTQNRTPQFGAAREGGGKQERKREKEAERGQNNLRLVEAAKVTNCFGPQLTKEILNHSSAPFAFWVQASV